MNEEHIFKLIGGTCSIVVNQDGGKYGRFKCPFCGNKATYKFSAGSGWCEHCEADFFHAVDICPITGDFTDIGFDVYGPGQKLSGWHMMNLECRPQFKTTPKRVAK